MTGLALFGSYARDQAADCSDVDKLVSFDGPATSKMYFGVQFYIEDLLGRPVDLVTEKALRRQLGGAHRPLSPGSTEGRQFGWLPLGAVTQGSPRGNGPAGVQ